MRSQTDNQRNQIGASPLFLGLFLLLLAFFIFLNSISSYQKGKSDRVVESVRANFPTKIFDADGSRIEKLDNSSLIAPFVVRKLNELFLIFLPNSELNLNIESMKVQVDIPVDKFFDRNNELSGVVPSAFLIGLAKILTETENSHPLDTKILFGYSKSSENRVADERTLKRAGVIMEELMRLGIPQGFTSIGVEPGHPQMLSFQFSRRAKDSGPIQEGSKNE
ncbi:MAG: hypothetical protein CMM58_09975 [Rhodospirillaceae bacterium]|nr:hypothetical protein [Rhodospirillaceae bacterium]|tara:strand:+ start:475 stop:1140 length:666 start_codon:yes stop_codon:yes gene_type:complete